MVTVPAVVPDMSEAALYVGLMMPVLLSSPRVRLPEAEVNSAMLPVSASTVPSPRMRSAPPILNIGSVPVPVMLWVRIFFVFMTTDAPAGISTFLTSATAAMSTTSSPEAIAAVTAS